LVAPGSLGLKSVRTSYMLVSGIRIVPRVEEKNPHRTFRENIRAWRQSKPVGKAFQPAICYPDVRQFNKADLFSVSFSRRRLPHWELEGSTYFVTYRMINDLPYSLAEHLSATGFALASIVEESLFFSHRERCPPGRIRDYASSRAPAATTRRQVATPSRSPRAKRIYCPRNQQDTPPQWQRVRQAESFDHLVRTDADWWDKFGYIHNNPVKAGLVSMPQDYLYSSLVTMYSTGRLESLPHKLDGRPQKGA